MKRINKVIVQMILIMAMLFTMVLGVCAEEATGITQEISSEADSKEEKATDQDKPQAISEPIVETVQETVPELSYQAHVAQKGWMTTVSAGQMAGTTGAKLNMEALIIHLKNTQVESPIRYRAKSIGVGWSDWSTSGIMTGTTGKKAPMEAIEIKLADALAVNYDIFYRVHVSNIGWLGWAKNGERAGSSYYGYGIEAIEIQLLSKSDDSILTGNAYKEKVLSINYQAHVSKIGWQSTVKNGQMAGTTGKSRVIEALYVKLENAAPNEITYRTRSVGEEWRDWQVGGGLGGTTGKSLAMEAIELKLSDELSQKYNLYYRVHVSNIGWLGWAKNGESAGSAYYGYGIEAIEIKLLPIGDTSISTGNSYKEGIPKVSYQAHVAKIGWQSAVTDGKTAGTTGKKLSVEAFKVKFLYTGKENAILGRSKSLTKAWSDWGDAGELVGTTGKSLALEAVELKLSDELSEKYSIYYRVHVANVGWLGWAKDGQRAGSSYYGYGIEAIEIRILDKNSTALQAGSSFKKGIPQMEYAVCVTEKGWLSKVGSGQMAGGYSKPIESINMNVLHGSDLSEVTYRTKGLGQDWSNWATEGTNSGVQGSKLGIEAIEIKLSEDLEQEYDIWYRTKCSYIGWLDWAKNGESAGSSGFYYPIEAVEIKIMEKSDIVPMNPSYVELPELSYQAHVAKNGWMNYVGNGEIAGTVGESLAVEAIRAQFGNGGLTGTLQISTKAMGAATSWGAWTNSNGISGTVGESKPLEAVRIRLTEALADVADVYYRVHVAQKGWLGWTKNGAIAGTHYMGYQVEAIQIKVLNKKDQSIELGESFLIGKQNGVDVSVYQGDIDWAKVRNAGISFAMLRCVSGSNPNNLAVDGKFNQNIKNASANGISVGVYRYGYAVTETQAQLEAIAVVNAIKNSGYRLQFPVAYDVEDENTQGKLTKAELAKIIKAFKGVIEMNGYKFMIYANKNWLDNKIDMTQFSKDDVWIARYRDGTPNLGHGYTGLGNVTIWQYSSTGKVDGIAGNVDVNIGYKQY